MNKINKQVDFMYLFHDSLVQLEQRVRELEEQYDISLEIIFEYHDIYLMACSANKIRFNLFKLKSKHWEPEGIELSMRFLMQTSNFYVGRKENRPHNHILIDNKNALQQFLETFGRPSEVILEREENFELECVQIIKGHCVLEDIVHPTFRYLGKD